MKRGVLVLVVGVTCALIVSACTLADAEGGSSPRTTAQEPGVITLRLRNPTGPWKKSLSLKLNRNRIRSFSVCAIRNWESGSQPFGCEVLGARLPEGTLRLEQNPIRSAAPRADSPGWGMLGLSIHDRLEAVLSNTAAGNRFGVVHYRVTLRAPSGQVLAESNRVAVSWHR